MLNMKTARTLDITTLQPTPQDVGRLPLPRVECLHGCSRASPLPMAAFGQ